MANFSINQVRHLYVVTAVKKGTDLLESDKVGSILLKQVEDGPTNYKYYQYMSPAGIVRSDLINVDNVISSKTTKSEALRHKLYRVLLTLDDSVSSAIVAGQEYITRIAFRQYIGLGEEDQNFKYGFVKATSNMSVSDFYKKMAISIANNVSKDTTPLVTVYLKTSDSEVKVAPKTKESTLDGTYTGIIIEEAEQAWELGTMPQEFIKFTVQPTDIIIAGDEYIWGKVTKETPVNFVKNGHNIADLEYFCMGARGDHYRMMGYPNIVKTKYLVDPDKEYDVMDIHYYFSDSNESVQKSERTLTLVMENDGSHTLLNSLLS